MRQNTHRLIASLGTAFVLAGIFVAGAVPPAGAAKGKSIPGLPVSAAHSEPLFSNGEERSRGPIAGTPILNFGVVIPGVLYRSSQPDDEGFRWLQEQGFRSVVSLRKEKDLGPDHLKQFGLKYLHLPIVDEDAPTDEQGRAFLEWVRNEENWPVLVHCHAGMGRAGTMAALARYAIDGWDMSDAMREARRYRLFHLRMFGDQRRWLNSWKDRFPAGEYHPSRPLPAWDTSTASKASKSESRKSGG